MTPVEIVQKLEGAVKTAETSSKALRAKQQEIAELQKKNDASIQEVQNLRDSLDKALDQQLFSITGPRDSRVTRSA